MAHCKVRDSIAVLVVLGLLNVIVGESNMTGESIFFPFSGILEANPGNGASAKEE